MEFIGFSSTIELKSERVIWALCLVSGCEIFEKISNLPKFPFSHRKISHCSATWWTLDEIVMRKVFIRNNGLYTFKTFIITQLKGIEYSYVKSKNKIKLKKKRHRIKRDVCVGGGCVYVYERQRQREQISKRLPRTSFTISSVFLRYLFLDRKICLEI